MVVEALETDAVALTDDLTPEWPPARWAALLDRIEHRQHDVGLRFWSSPLWLEVTMEGPDADRWPTVTARTAWDWQSNVPCTEAAELAASGADEARILPVVARYTIENLILNAVHEVGEWLRVDGRRVFPPHSEPAAAGGDEGNGSVTLEFAYGTNVSPGGAVGDHEPAGPPSQSRRLVDTPSPSFTYLPQTSISYDEVGPTITRWSQPQAPWRSRWSPSSSRLDTREMLERGVHRMLVLHEADRICRAFHVDGRRPWRLETCGQDLQQAGPGDGSVSAEPLSITIVDAAPGTSSSNHTALPPSGSSWRPMRLARSWTRVSPRPPSA